MLLPLHARIVRVEGEELVPSRRRHAACAPTRPLALTAVCFNTRGCFRPDRTEALRGGVLPLLRYAFEAARVIAARLEDMQDT